MDMWTNSGSAMSAFSFCYGFFQEHLALLFEAYDTKRIGNILIKNEIAVYLFFRVTDYFQKPSNVDQYEEH